MNKHRLTTDDYLHGHCHIYALALHEKTGYPIHAFLDSGMMGMTVLLHAFVSPDGGKTALDARGSYPVSQVLDFYDHFEPEHVVLQPGELLELGEGSAKLTKAVRKKIDNCIETLDLQSISLKS